jgi:large repetitive protein
MRRSPRRAAVVFALSLLIGLVATVAGVVEPASAGTFTTTGVPGTFQLNDITCVDATTCVAVGSSSGQGAAAVEIVNGVAGTVATSTDSNADRLDRVVCVGTTSCLASGIGDTAGGEGEVIPITLGAQATIGTPQYVTGTYELFGLACSTATTCVAVGGTSISGADSVGAVVDIDDGTAEPVKDVSGVVQFLGVGCPSSSTCVAAGSFGAVSVDVITNGTPGTVKSLNADMNVYNMSCSSGSCVAVGYDLNSENQGQAAYLSISPTGTAGTVQEVTGASIFTGVQCPTSTCVAVGTASISGGNVGAIDAFTPGSAAGPPQDDPDSSGFSGVYCTAALSCLASGDGTGSTANEGIVATGSLTAPTATVSGTVSFSDKGTTTPLQGSPLQICATDGTFCTAGVNSAADGSYSFTVPAGDTYVVTAYSPVGDSYTAGLSAATTAATAGQSYSGVDVTVTPGPGLGSGVSVTGFGAEQNSGTAVPTVNWGIPFAVTLAPSVFSTPTGDSSTLLTLALTGVNTQTGAVVTKTVYAGGEITVNGQAAAVGLPIDPTHGVTVQIPVLAPIHGPVGMAITYSSSPNPATGVTAAPDPLVLTNGTPTASVTVAATDFGVDHTVGTATLSGTDSGSFSIGKPDCAGANLVQNSGGTSPSQSCAIPVTWHAPTTPSKNTYSATISVPVTNSSGQTGVLQDPLFACDTRIQGNSQCTQGSPPAPPASPTPVGGPTGVPIGGLYVDPSGQVETPVAGGGTAPFSGATVTLSMEDPSTSTYTNVPNGSDIMSPANRVNPVTTGADGSFGWDTLAGTYEITAAKSGCSNTPATTDPITVPPAATGIIISLDCTVSQTSTTTGLTSSPAAPVTGDAVTLVASVTGSSPTGTVTFQDGTTDLGSASVDSSSGEATLSVATLNPGSHTITASYGGDAGNVASQNHTTVSVATPAKVATTTTATANPTASKTGQAVSYRATVSPQAGSAAPSGQVTFSVGATSLCAAAASSGGPGLPATATCSASKAPVGVRTVVATYSGDSEFTGSTGTASESVTPPALSVKTTSLAAGAKGKPYRVTLAHAGGGGSYSWKVASGTLPAGLKLSSGGQLAGTPSKAGSHSFVVRVSDSDNQSTTKKLTVKIAEIAVKTTRLKGGKKGARYSVKLTVYGGSGTLAWSHSGKLPRGLTISKSGTISGKPTTIGTFAFVVKVKDHTGATARKRLVVVIRK